MLGIRLAGGGCEVRQERQGNMGRADGAYYLPTWGCRCRRVSVGLGVSMRATGSLRV